MDYNSIRAIVFDLDYTLLDSSDGIAYCFNQARRERGEEEVDPSLIKTRIGLPIEETFRVFGSAEPEGMRELFRKIAREGAMAERSFLLPGVAETLPVLSDRGYRMAVNSTKSRAEIERVLEYLGVHGFFENFVGSDEVAKPKPAPDSLLLMLDRLGLGPREVVYVGDHVVDARSARSAGLPAVIVLGGPAEREEVENEKPDLLLPGVSAMLDYFNGPPA